MRLKEVEYLEGVHQTYLATSAGQGSKEAQKQIKTLTKAQQQKAARRTNKVQVGMPLSEEIPQNVPKQSP